MQNATCKAMNLKEFYENLPHSSAPKQEFVRELATACKVTETAVRNWIQGRARPADPDHVNCISKVTKIPVEELFPERC